MAAIAISTEQKWQHLTPYSRPDSPFLKLIVCETKRPFAGKKIRGLEDLFELLERRWAMRLLWALSEGAQRYGTLRTRFGINPNTLRDRLFELEDAGLILHVAPSPQRLHAAYELSEVGVKVVRCLRSLGKISKTLSARAAAKGSPSAIIEIEPRSTKELNT